MVKHKNKKKTCQQTKLTYDSLYGETPKYDNLKYCTDISLCTICLQPNCFWLLHKGNAIFKKKKIKISHNNDLTKKFGELLFQIKPLIQINNNRLYLYVQPPDEPQYLPPNDTINISVEPITTQKAIINLTNRGVKPRNICSIIFASQYRVGGGVYRGSGSAQEEQVIYQSPETYYVGQLADQRSNIYPLDGNKLYFVKDTTFYYESFLDFDNVVDFINQPGQIKTNFAFVASKDGRNCDVKEWSSDMYEKIKTLILGMIEQGFSHIVLGALGCGIYLPKKDGDPKIVAQYFYDILVTEGYGYYFDEIVFPIAVFKKSDNKNLTLFQEVLC